MKKFFTKLVANATDYALLIILMYSVMQGVKSLTGLTVAAYWVIMALAFFLGPLIYFISHAAKNAKDEESRRKALEFVESAVKKKNLLIRFVGCLKLISICCLLAYGGWIFTAVCYALMSLYLRLLISLARDNVAEQKNTGVA